MDIEDFENAIKQKAVLEKHIKGHVKLDHGKSDELKIAEDVLEELNLQEMKSYEDSLKALKIQIKEADGKLNVETIDHIAATMEKAAIFLDSSRDKLGLVGGLDEGFEENTKNVLPKAIEEDDGHFRNAIPVVGDSIGHINPVEQYSNEVKDAFKKAAEDSHNFLHEKKLTHHVHVEKEEFPSVFLPLHFSVTLTILSLLVLVVVVAASRFRFNKNRMEKDVSTETGYDNFACVNSRQGMESVKEDDGWNSKNWAKSWGGDGSRRKRR